VLTAQGQHAAAADLRDKAFEAAPATSGVITTPDTEATTPPVAEADQLLKAENQATRDTPFEWLADADSRLGPVMEAVVNGRYYWIPLHRVKLIKVDPPADLRDVIWTPVHFQWANGGETVGLIPTRYAGTEKSSDPLIRLARKTDWQELAPGVFAGLGQRMLATDGGEYPIMDVREIRFNASEAT